MLVLLGAFWTIGPLRFFIFLTFWCNIYRQYCQFHPQIHYLFREYAYLRRNPWWRLRTVRWTCTFIYVLYNALQYHWFVSSFRFRCIGLMCYYCNFKTLKFNKIVEHLLTIHPREIMKIRKIIKDNDTHCLITRTFGQIVPHDLEKRGKFM